MATCPLCDYTGSWRSVEGHISGMTDDDHRGKVGQNYRERIKETVGESPTLEGDERATMALPAEGSGGGSSESGPSVQVEESEEVSGWGLVASTAVVAVVVVLVATTSTPDLEGQASGVDELEADGQQTNVARRYQ